MGNQFTKKKEHEASEAMAASLKAEQEAKKLRTLVRIRIYRMDNTIDETVQTFPRMQKGETITFTATPENE